MSKKKENMASKRDINRKLNDSSRQLRNNIANTKQAKTVSHHNRHSTFEWKKLLKNGAFIFGSILIAVTWYFDRVVIEGEKEYLENYREARAEYMHTTTQLFVKHLHKQFAMVNKEKYGDSTEQKKAIYQVHRDLAWWMNSHWAAMHDMNVDTLDVTYREIAESNRINIWKLYTEKNDLAFQQYYNHILSLASEENMLPNHFVWTRAYWNRKGRQHFLSIMDRLSVLFYILGTLLIAASYLRQYTVSSNFESVSRLDDVEIDRIATQLLSKLS